MTIHNHTSEPGIPSPCQKTDGSPGGLLTLPVVKSSGKKINVAIDGFSSCGKSTLAKGMAKALGFGYIDSGAMYRAVTLHMLRLGVVNPKGLDRKGVLD